MMDLFVNLLTAHLLADFPLQKDAWIRNKQERRLRGFGIWKHSVVVLLTTILALGFSEYIYLWVAIGMTIIHVAIDYLKVKFTKNDPFAFALDQILHVIVLFSMSCLITKYSDWHQWRIVPQGKELFCPLLFCGYLFCLSPANYVIREVLKYCHVQNGAKDDDEEANESVRTSGSLIGSMERFLVLTFILMGNYEAAGLTIAAKSLLRFNDNEGPRTEYVLVGTLLSITIAVVCAIVIFKFGMDVSVFKKP